MAARVPSHASHGEGPSEQEAVADAAVRSVAVDGLGLYWHSAGPHPAGLVVGYATPPEHAFTGALDALTATLGMTKPRPDS